MKILGIIFIVLGSLSLLGSLLAVANGATRRIGGGIAFIVLGAYLIHRANQKTHENKEHDDWSNE